MQLTRFRADNLKSLQEVELELGGEPGSSIWSLSVFPEERCVGIDLGGRRTFTASTGERTALSHLPSVHCPAGRSAARTRIPLDQHLEIADESVRSRLA